MVSSLLAAMYASGYDTTSQASLGSVDRTRSCDCGDFSCCFSSLCSAGPLDYVFGSGVCM